MEAVEFNSSIHCIAFASQGVRNGAEVSRFSLSMQQIEAASYSYCGYISLYILYIHVWLYSMYYITETYALHIMT